jgi:hypothetical protein
MGGNGCAKAHSNRRLADRPQKGLKNRVEVFSHGLQWLGFSKALKYRDPEQVRLLCILNGPQALNISSGEPIEPVSVD